MTEKLLAVGLKSICVLIGALNSVSGPLASSLRRQRINSFMCPLSSLQITAKTKFREFHFLWYFRHNINSICSEESTRKFTIHRGYIGMRGFNFSVKEASSVVFHALWFTHVKPLFLIYSLCACSTVGFGCTTLLDSFGPCKYDLPNREMENGFVD